MASSRIIPVLQFSSSPVLQFSGGARRLLRPRGSEPNVRTTEQWSSSECLPHPASTDTDVYDVVAHFWFQLLHHVTVVPVVVKHVRTVFDCL